MTAPAALLRDVKTAANSSSKIFVSAVSDPCAPARHPFLLLSFLFGEQKKSRIQLQEFYSAR